MNCESVRHYQDEASDVVEQVTQRQDSLVQLTRGIDGFAAYLLDPGNGGIATVCGFEAREGVEESTRAAAQWVAETVAGGRRTPPTVIQGSVAFSSTR